MTRNVKELSMLTYVQNKLPHFTEHLISIIPDTVEPQHLAIKLQELALFVHITWRLCNLRQ